MRAVTAVLYAGLAFLDLAAMLWAASHGAPLWVDFAAGAGAGSCFVVAVVCMDGAR